MICTRSLLVRRVGTARHSDGLAHDRAGTNKCWGDGGRWARMIRRAEREEDQLGELCPV